MPLIKIAVNEGKLKWPMMNTVISSKFLIVSDELNETTIHPATTLLCENSIVHYIIECFIIN